MELLGEMEGTVMSRQKNYKSILTRADVVFLRKKAREGMSDRDIHQTYFPHVGPVAVIRARRGVTWKHVPDAFPDEDVLAEQTPNEKRRDALIHALSMIDSQIDRALLQGFARNSSYVEGLRENRRKLTTEQINLEDTMRKRGEL